MDWSVAISITTVRFDVFAWHLPGRPTKPLWKSTARRMSSRKLRPRDRIAPLVVNNRSLGGDHSTGFVGGLCEPVQHILEWAVEPDVLTLALRRVLR